MDNIYQILHSILYPSISLGYNGLWGKYAWRRVQRYRKRTLAKNGHIPHLLPRWDKKPSSDTVIEVIKVLSA